MKSILMKYLVAISDAQELPIPALRFSAGCQLSLKAGGSSSHAGQDSQKLLSPYNSLRWQWDE